MGTIFGLFLLVAAGMALGIKDIAIIILSQENEHHSKIAHDLSKNLAEQAERSPHKGNPVVHLSHEDFPHVGAWTVLPLIPRLFALHGSNTSWFVFVEDRTQIVLETLLRTLALHNSDEPLWLGHSVHDTDATIIHHFAFYDNPEIFKYPNMASGIALSVALLQRLADRLTRTTHHSEFGIDSGHELALFVWDKGRGHVLTDEPAFCVRDHETCATSAAAFRQCGEPVPKRAIYFAVKTCSKYHKNRIQVVQRTWARHVDKIEYFSEVTDPSVPTLDLGVPNTENGHCAKTVAILKHARGMLDRDRHIQWVVLADDDTILGVSRLLRLLTCYNASQPIALGERYGYNVYNKEGYNYITGGGGVVFSRTLVKQLTRVGVCECPSINAPDDMFLGLCMANLGVSVTHSHQFHQARPVDYPGEYLQSQDAVSFHKHWMIDPVGVYNKWFAEDDANYDVHNEL